MTALLTLAAIGLLGFGCQWLAYRVKLPAILFLLLAGILAGPVLSMLDPQALFGDLLFPYISLSVAVILFEGSLTLKRSELREIGVPVRRLVTVGVLVSATLIATASHYLFDMSWQLAALFGAIMVVTGPTVIMPMLKTVRPIPKVADVLRWEGIIIDPIGALTAVLVFEWIVVQQSAAHLSEVFSVFGTTVLVGSLTGLSAGFVFGLLLRNNWIPERLQNFAALALVCFVFAVCDSLAHESGLLGVTVMGIWLANMRDVQVHSILEFKEDLTLVFVSALFIVLAARLDTASFLALGMSGVLLLLWMQLVVRPIKVWLSFLGSGFSWREQALVAWIGPRGIVAAAVSSVFALRLEELGVAGAEQLVPLTFMMIIGTVVLQSLTAGPIARVLKVAMPPTHGVLIVGANPLSAALAQALEKNDVCTLICDSNWDRLREVRLRGLSTYYGNPSSEHAQLQINTSPYGYLLGLSNHFEYNVTQANGFRDEFGTRSVLVLPPNQSVERHRRHIASRRYSGRLLFTPEMSYSHLKKRLNQGYEIRVTELSGEYDYARWQDNNPDALVLLVLRNGDELLFNTVDAPLEPETEDKLFFLAPEDDRESDAG